MSLRTRRRAFGGLVRPERSGRVPGPRGGVCFDASVTAGGRGHGGVATQECAGHTRTSGAGHRSFAANIYYMVHVYTPCPRLGFCFLDGTRVQRSCTCSRTARAYALHHRNE